MFRKISVGEGRLVFSSSAHSPIKNFVEGGGNQVVATTPIMNISPKGGMC